MISIATVSIKDIARLKSLAGKTFQESHGHSAPGSEIRAYLERSFNQRVLEAELNDRRNLFYMMFSEEKTVGYSKMVINSPSPGVGEALMSKLERLYLLSEFHGCKLGKQLFDFNVSLSQKLGQKGMWLYVWKENEKAIRFYERNGFRQVGSSEFRIGENHVNPNHILLLRY